MTTNDKYLFERIKAGSKTEFDTLFRFYYEDLCRFAVFLSCSAEDAEEIVQDVFYKLWVKRQSIEIKISAKAYLFTAVRNTVYNIHKHEKIKKKYIEETRLENSIVDPEESNANEEIYKRIDSVIDLMPEKRREVFRLSKVEGLKYKEIAEKLNISTKTVENHMGEALKFLRANLNKTELILLFMMMDVLTWHFFSIGVFSNLIVN
ncbi:MAG: RNA polymerase sigma-70 factor [Bacteroidales bacterium]|nr:RNA polymerase sigma-70 factor [Bacteroidales bacterium]